MGSMKPTSPVAAKTCRGFALFISRNLVHFLASTDQQPRKSCALVRRFDRAINFYCPSCVSWDLAGFVYEATFLVQHPHCVFVYLLLWHCCAKKERPHKATVKVAWCPLVNRSSSYSKSVIPQLTHERHWQLMALSNRLTNAQIFRGCFLLEVKNWASFL